MKLDTNIHMHVLALQERGGADRATCRPLPSDANFIALTVNIRHDIVYLQRVSNVNQGRRADLGLLQWWGCSSNARAKIFGPRTLN